MFNLNSIKKQNQPNMNSVVNGANSAASNYREEGTFDDAQREAFINSKVQELEKQHLEFIKKNPEFDIKAEMENPVFKNYVLGAGLSIEDAYILTHKEEILGALEKKTSKRTAMSDRIAENGAGKNSPASVKKNPKDMSDKEIDAIIERVNRGEKISF